MLIGFFPHGVVNLDLSLMSLDEEKKDKIDDLKESVREERLGKTGGRRRKRGRKRNEICS
jgi:hypothetical protein